MNRVERKKKEYKMATIRTMCNIVATVITALSFLFTLLIYHRVYWG